jgi:outer membrane immunogenic protein
MKTGVMYKNFSILVASTVLFATPAVATGFSGPRAEARGGWDRTTMDLSYDDGVDSFSGDAHKDGFNIGAEVGYDAPIGPSIIAGAYAGVEFATTKACSEIFGNDEACLKLGRNFTIGGRLGTKVSPSTLLYVKGGYSNGQLKAKYSSLDDPTLNFSAHANRDGFHFGAGAEVLVGSKGYIRAEYVRTNYNDYDYSDPDFAVKLDAHRDQVLLGFGLRF